MIMWQALLMGLGEAGGGRPGRGKPGSTEEPGRMGSSCQWIQWADGPAVKMEWRKGGLGGGRGAACKGGRDNRACRRSAIGDTAGFTDHRRVQLDGREDAGQVEVKRAR